MIRKLAMIFCIIFIFVACKDTPSGSKISDYDRLCKIYEEIGQKPLKGFQKAIQISEEIEKQLPDFFNKHFVHIINDSNDRHYSLFKEVAKFETGVDWECAAIKIYYEGGYDDK